MSQTHKTATKFAGLTDYPNSLSEAPAGALQVADNVVIDKPSVVSARRGQQVYSRLNDESNLCTRLFQVGDALYGLFTSDGLPTTPGDLRRLREGTTLPSAAITGVNQPPGNAMHSVEANSNVYLSTGDGILKLLPTFTGSSSGTSVPAGMPFGLDVQGVLATPATGTLGFLAGDSATGYSVLFGSTDNEGNLVLGAPSPTVTVANPTLTGGVLQNPGSSFLPPVNGVSNFDVTVTGVTSGLGGYVYVVQGATVLRAFANLHGANTLRIILVDTVEFFGVAGSTVTLVVPINITSVAGSVLTYDTTTISLSGLNGVTCTFYQPYNASNPASAAEATLTSAVSATSGTTLTIAAGTALAGPGALLINTAISAPQQSVVFAYSTATALVGFTPGVNDVLTLPDATVETTVTASSVITIGSDTSARQLTLSAFPSGMSVWDRGFHASYTTTFTAKRPQSVAVTFTVPKEISAYTAAGLATFYQVYRSQDQVPLDGEPTASPNANMRLAYQATLTGAETRVTITDIAPDSTLGADLYTSPQQQGALAAKYPPPVASDMCLYQDVMLYANCLIPAAFSTTLLGVSATTNASLGALQPGDVITVNGSAFTARTAPTLTTEFKIFTGSGSVTLDIARTVADFARVVNQTFVLPTAPGSALETVNVLATPDTSTTGGQFTIRTSRGLGTFTLAYTPVGGHPSPFADKFTGTFNSTLLQNALYYTPPEEPEAVPLLNELPVGQANTPVLRVLSLPGSCIIFKPEGIYQLTGTTAEQFSVSLLNTTAQLLANESAVLLQSSVVAYTNQGVITVSQGGVQITSMAINDTLRALSGLSSFPSTAFAVAHEAERRYMLWVPTVDGDALPTQAYTYNILTNAWSRWPFGRVCGLVNRSDQLLYSGVAVSTATGTPAAYVEADPSEAYAYGDEAITGTVALVDATTIRFVGTTMGDATAMATNFTRGSALITTTGVVFPLSAEVVGETLQFTLTDTSTLVDGDEATYYLGYLCQFAPVPIEADDAGTVKQFQEFQLAFVNTGCPFITAICYTDFNQDLTALSLVPISLRGLAVGFGSGPFGGFAWGGGVTTWPVLTQNARQLVPKGATRGHYFWPLVSAVVAAVGFNVQGLTLAWAPTRSQRSR